MNYTGTLGLSDGFSWSVSNNSLRMSNNLTNKTKKNINSIFLINCLNNIFTARKCLLLAPENRSLFVCTLKHGLRNVSPLTIINNRKTDGVTHKMY